MSAPSNGDVHVTDPQHKARFVRVPVTVDDRVETVAARFGLSAAELRQHNRSCIFEYFTVDHVWVPRDKHATAADRPRESDEDNVNRRAVLRRAFLLRATEATPEEADYYIDEAGSGGLERALSQYRDDVAWTEGRPVSEASKAAPGTSSAGPLLPPEYAPSAPPM